MEVRFLPGALKETITTEGIMKFAFVGKNIEGELILVNNPLTALQFDNERTVNMYMLDAAAQLALARNIQRQSIALVRHENKLIMRIMYI